MLERLQELIKAKRGPGNRPPSAGGVAPALTSQTMTKEKIMTTRLNQVTSNVGSHGQYQTSFEGLAEMIDEYWDKSLPWLWGEIKELNGDINYHVADLKSKVACLMILAELRGHATN